jgi:drug/metabolite transporter (DMT)-like permease
LHPTTKSSNLLPALAIASVVVVWGGSFIAARHLLHPGTPGAPVLDPITLAASRFTLASLFFLVPFGAAVAKGAVSGRDLLRMALLGQIAFSTYYWFQYTGVRNTNAGLASILAVGLLPSAAAVLAPLGGEKRPGGRAWLALLLGFAGVVAITLERPVDISGSRRFLVGALCLTANAFAFATYSLLSRRWMKGVSPVTLTGGAMIAGSIGLLAMTAAGGSAPVASLAALRPSQWGALAYLVLFCSVGAYVAWTWALSRVEASRATVCVYSEPVVALILGALFLGESYGLGAFIGAAAVAASVLLTLMK